MSITTHTTGSLDQILDDFDRRLGRLEQIATAPINDIGTIPGVVIDDGTHPPLPIDTNPPDGVIGLTVTPGTFYEDIFADADWSPPLTGVLPAAYDLELGDPSNSHALITFEQTGGTNFRFLALQPNKSYGVRVTSVSAVGIRGTPSAWVDFTTGLDATLPAAPQHLVVFRAPDSLIATWDSNTEKDVAWGHGIYEVEISTNNFATIAATIRTAATVVSFDGIVTEATYKVRVRAIDSSGNAGPDTTSGNIVAGSIITPMIQNGAITATVIADDAITTPKIMANAVTAAEIAALTITGAQIAAGAITAVKIVAGTITANEIAGNSITADKLTTSSLTAATITLAGGSLKAGNPPTTGLLLNSQGLRLYSGGVAQVTLDVGGTATFSGTVSAATIIGSAIQGGTITGTVITGATVRSAAGVPRVELNALSGSLSGSFYHKIEFHTGAGLSGGDDYRPGQIFAWHVPTAPGGGHLALQAPQPTSSYSGNAQVILQNYGNGTSNVLMSAGGGYIVFGNIGWSNHGGMGFWAQNVYAASTPAFYSSSSGTHAHMIRGDVVGAQCSMVAAGGDGGPTRMEFVNGSLSGFIALYASAYTIGSARETKVKIVDLPPHHQKFDQLRPRSYTRRAHGLTPPPSFPYERGRTTETVDPTPQDVQHPGVEWGFIADEMAEVFPECVDLVDGKPFAINYTMLIPVLVNAVQDLRKRVAQFEQVK